MANERIRIPKRCTTFKKIYIYFKQSTIIHSYQTYNSVSFCLKKHYIHVSPTRLKYGADNIWLTRCKIPIITPPRFKIYTLLYYSENKFTKFDHCLMWYNFHFLQLFFLDFNPLLLIIQFDFVTDFYTLLNICWLFFPSQRPCIQLSNKFSKYNLRSNFSISSGILETSCLCLSKNSYLHQTFNDLVQKKKRRRILRKWKQHIPLHFAVFELARLRVELIR